MSQPTKKTPPFICRNCGKTGKHSWCKEIFSSADRMRIDNDVRILLEERQNKPSKKKVNREQLEHEPAPASTVVEDPDFPQYGPLPPPLCGNCAQLGHRTCSVVYSEMDRIQISELYKTRKIERDLRLKERAKDFDRRRMAYKRKEPEVQERERVYKLSKSYRDSCNRTDTMKKR
jgi:hypothetical protein